MCQSPLQGRTALITGASHRIGRAIALMLAQKGVNVVVHYSSSEREARTLAEELRKQGVDAWTIGADFAKPAAAEKLMERTFEVASSLDILVNNAAIFAPSTLQNMDFTGLMEHLCVNTWTPLVLSREFVRLAGKGRIINLLDARIAANDSGHVAYLLSKQMLASLTAMMAREFAPDVTVNGIAPGPILPPPGKDEAYLQRMASSLPLKRPGGPADIAAAVRYLIENDFVTGQILYVDGGQHLKEHEDGSNFNP